MDTFVGLADSHPRLMSMSSDMGMNGRRLRMVMARYMLDIPLGSGQQLVGVDHCIVAMADVCGMNKVTTNTHDALQNCKPKRGPRTSKLPS